MATDTKNSTWTPAFQRFWKPTPITGLSGIAVDFRLDEMLLFGEEILALISLFIMAGVIFLLNILLFKSRIPRREDMENKNVKGNKK